MTGIKLLEALKERTIEATKDLLMPVRQQKSDSEPIEPRAAQIFLARVPDGKSADKKAPYILHQITTGKDVQEPGQLVECQRVVRSIFCVYSADEQEGGLMLLNLMERVRISLLKDPIIGKQFVLDLDAGLEMFIYPDDTAPYFIGEMASTWDMPKVKREVPEIW